jgi:hypothetical protein
MIVRIVSLILTLALGGCGDPISSYINKKWPPVSADQQRQTAIASAATTLSTMTIPNVAASFNFEDVKKVIEPEIKKISGIQKADIVGEDQLLRVDVQFSKEFTEADVAGDATATKLLKELHPQIDGKIAVYLGATSGSAADSSVKEIALKLLPVFHSIHVDKVVVVGKVDATVVGDVLATVLTKYSENISGEISRSPSMSVVLPAEIGGDLDPNRTITIADKSGQGNVKVTGTTVTSPVRLQAIAWLITDKNIRTVAQFLPVATSNPTDDLKIEPTFGKIKDRFDAISTDVFAVTDSASGTWAAIRKDLVSLVLNSAIGQAAICIEASAETAPQTAGNKVSFPDADKIDCSTDDSCYSKRSCDGIVANHDTRDCNTCLVWKPKLCDPWGNNCIGGGCGLRGNDPVCELAKAGQNLIYETDAAGRRLDCGRLVLQENTACELKRAGQKTLCEGGKATLKALDKTGNIANIDITTKAKTTGLQVCLKQFAIAPDLSNVQIALDIQGTASADVGIKFTPLDIVGHLACQFPWADTKTFSAQLRESKVTLSSIVKFDHSDNADRMLFTTSEQTIPMLLKPSPTEYLLTSVNMTLACQGLNLVKPLAVSLTPFIPELRGNIDYKLPSQDFAVGLPLPGQKVGDQTVAATLKDTGKALGLFATVTKK